VKSSFIKCSAGRHKFTLHDDGTMCSSGCELHDDEIERLATMIRLGGEPDLQHVESCVGLAALLRHGLDDTIGQGARTIAELGGWRGAYVRWESQQHVVAKVKRLSRETPAHRAEREAKKLLRRIPFFRRMLEVDFNTSIEFELSLPVLPTELQGDASTWLIVPLQKGWISEVFEDERCKQLHRADPETLVLGKRDSGELVRLRVDRQGQHRLEAVA
jgi:hypothetical protein